jgi:diguanylate cyclase (GGDEF)-like protein
MYFDLDRFKSINDRSGHAEGDRALRDFAKLLQQASRESEVIGRIGGDEFAVFATGAVDEGLAGALGRLHVAVADCNREGQRGYDIAYSVGAGAFDATDRAPCRSGHHESCGHADVSPKQRRRAAAENVLVKKGQGRATALPL